MQWRGIREPGEDDKSMELRLNLVLLALIVAASSSLTAAEPVAALDPDAPSTRELAAMEDAFAQDPSDIALARGLAETYIDLRRPGLAIAVLRAGDPQHLDHPMVAHRLAQAYEQGGRVLDALATSDLALARCARSLGTADAPSGTPVPVYSCTARQHAVLEMHRNALVHMVRWGVADPIHDPRTRRAYDLSIRRASIASFAE